jgi:hypothetical protein
MSLPVELIELILKSLYYRDDGCPDGKSLKHCSLVSLPWRDISQRFLFRTLQFGSMINRFRVRPISQSLIALRATFSSSARGHLLGSYVRHLNIQIGILRSTLTLGSGYSPEEFLPILSLFPRLYELSLYTVDAEAVVVKYIAAWGSSSTLPQLRALTLHGPSPSSSLLYRLLEFWPTIQYLTFNNTTYPPPPESSNLRLVYLSYHMPVSPGILQWLVPDSIHSLQILKLHMAWNLDDDSATVHLVERQGAYIRSLELFNLPETIHRLFALLPNLEELDIEFLEHPIPQNVIESIPSTLKHIRIRGLPDEGILSDSAVVLVRRLPNLRIVTLPLCSSESEEWSEAMIDSWRGFEAVCAHRGVSVVRDSRLSRFVSVCLFSLNNALNDL